MQSAVYMCHVYLVWMTVVGDASAVVVHGTYCVQVSAAMGNASAEVKSIASFIAPTNDEGGVAFAIREALRL